MQKVKGLTNNDYVFLKRSFFYRNTTILIRREYDSLNLSAIDKLKTYLCALHHLKVV